MEVSGQLHTLATLPPPQGKSPSYPMDWRLVENQSQSGHGDEEKNSQPLLGLIPPIMQPTAQCYTTELPYFHDYGVCEGDNHSGGKDTVHHMPNFFASTLA